MLILQEKEISVILSAIAITKKDNIQETVERQKNSSSFNDLYIGDC